MQPDPYPVFILSRGRHAHTSRMAWDALDQMGVPYRLIVEPHEEHQYRERFDGKGACRGVIVVPQQYHDQYDPADGYDHVEHDGAPVRMGVGPARNVAWDTARQEGSPWHWQLDDDVGSYLRMVKGKQVHAGGPPDGVEFFLEMEDAIAQYANVGGGGPSDRQFVLAGTRPRKNTKVYHVHFLRSALPFQWKGRMVEDDTLYITMLQSRWCSLLLNGWCTGSPTMDSGTGGYADDLYRAIPRKDIILALARRHPGMVTLTKRYGRWHHKINWRKHFGDLPLLKDLEYQPRAAVNRPES